MSEQVAGQPVPRVAELAWLVTVWAFTVGTSTTCYPSRVLEPSLSCSIVLDPKNMSVIARTNTLLSFSAPSILRYLSRNFPRNRAPSGPLLYVLSPAQNLDSTELSNLVSHLTSIPNSVGCLGAILPVSVGGFPHSFYSTTLSLAQFHPHNALAFRSIVPGKPHAQVGSWHGGRNSEKVDSWPNLEVTAQLDAPPWQQGIPSLPPEVESFR